MKLMMALLAVCAGAAADYMVPRPLRAGPDEAPAMTLCGQNLAEAHALFCYEAGYVKKKSLYPPHARLLALSRYGPRADDDMEALAAAGWPWLEHHRANAFTAGGRSKRGIVEECCFKPCTRAELITYC